MQVLRGKSLNKMTCVTVKISSFLQIVYNGYFTPFFLATLLNGTSNSGGDSNVCLCFSLSAAGVGFILVIDRRQDRWTCVKGTLLRISVSALVIFKKSVRKKTNHRTGLPECYFVMYFQSGFPGNLRLVLVLRPHTLLQRTLSDIFFKFHGDDFRMKVPVNKQDFSRVLLYKVHIRYVRKMRTILCVFVCV